MNIYIKNKTTRRIVAIAVVFPVWALIIYGLGNFALVSITHFGMLGVILAIALAVAVDVVLSNQVQKINQKKIVDKRRKQINEMRRREYKKAGILDKYEPLGKRN